MTSLHSTLVLGCLSAAGWARRSRSIQLPARPISTRRITVCLMDDRRAKTIAAFPASVSGIADVLRSRKYDAWILDQFGVLHDGKKAYPEAVATLEHLSKEGVKLVLLSNSSRRSEVTRKKLPSLGFDPAMFHAIITSGELTHRSLLQRADPWFQKLGNKCIHMTWTSRGGVTLEGLGLQVVDSVQDADFILAHGTEGLASSDGSVIPASMEELEDVLKAAADIKDRQIPLVVANPDFVTVEERALRVMPGTLGKMYSSLGGVVKRMGKPDMIVFQEASSVTGVPPERCIMVGDSLHHDIIGASQCGIDSLFICGGVHADELGITDLGSLPEREPLEALCTKEGIWPTYVAPMFAW